MASSSSDAAPGESLRSQYSIVEKIGEGGMGVVYLGQDRKLGRYVAIKRLHKTNLADPHVRERFFREAKAVAALNHIHIVHIYTLAEDEDGPYIVMEYVPGPRDASLNKVPPHPFTLADCVHSGGPLGVSEALGLLLKVCGAVEYAHSCGVIHRDLKPSNVLLSEHREPKLVDFGLARQMSSPDDRITVPGEKMLSLGYGAPEQEADAGTADERADVYGLGGLIYFSVTGKNPRYFRESDLAQQAKFANVDFQDEVRRPEDHNAKDVQAKYYAMIALIDDQFARVLECLEQTGQRDNTVIIFTSDHGETLGDHGLMFKGCRFYEGLV
ncbi:MAG: protein kinase, partial [Lentisphaerae bacterium]|nr:protein kinase [Lentisphaerota bacterium]